MRFICTEISRLKHEITLNEVLSEFVQPVLPIAV